MLQYAKGKATPAGNMAANNALCLSILLYLGDFSSVPGGLHN
jgi:hypothetical protein